jgi:hypothetical protein
MGTLRLSKTKAWLCVVGAAVVYGAAAFVYYGLARNQAGSTQVVALQLAGSVHGAKTVLGSNAAAFRLALSRDFVLIAGYTIALVLACYVGTRVALSRAGGYAAAIGMWWAGAAGLSNVAQDIVLLHAIGDPSKAGHTAFLIAQTLAFAKFALVFAAGAIAVCSLFMAVGRLLKANTRSSHWAPKMGRVMAPPPPRDHPFWWERAAEERPAQEPAADAEPCWNQRAVHWCEGARVAPGRQPAPLGICVSGGGVRSGTVTLGALQALRDQKQLQQARYLVSVSGGGYITGALQQALAAHLLPEPKPADGQKANPTPEDVYKPGSAEEDYTRRHSDYLADSLRQWMAALGGLLFRLLCSLALIGLVVATVGILLGLFYRATQIVLGTIPVLDDALHTKPIASLEAFEPKFLLHCPQHVADMAARRYCDLGPPLYHPRAGVLIAIGIVAAAAVAAYLARPLARPLSRRPTIVARGLLTTAGLLAGVGILLPMAVWASAWVTWHGGPAKPGNVLQAATGTAVLSFIGTLAATMWRKRKSLGGGTGFFSSFRKKAGQVMPNSMVQMFLIWICLLALITVLTLASGWFAAGGADAQWWAVLPIGVLVLVGVLLDQTTLSLHPFYRRRLASAFAVRRIRRRDLDLAEAYPYTVSTPLSAYAERAGTDFPQVIFQAAANITGQDRTPPGRRSVSYTLASDFVGGPQVGWVATEELENLVSQRLKRDLTVQGAVAISGAAFASAMGSQTRFYEVFLALANARLGAWLPNPYYVWMKSRLHDEWAVPGLPSRRRLSYYAREILGLHPSTNALLLCTDGGHYENLGLVELLRHRCRVIYCIDASGDSPPLAATLAQAVTLAREELGVTIKLTSPLDLVPGSATPLEPTSPLAALNARLSRTAVCVGEITYPEEVHYVDQHRWAHTTDKGHLIVAKAVLTADAPYHLLSYALDNVAFPRDSTGDQWFNCDQFDAYQALGRHIAERAVKAAVDNGTIDGAGRLIWD